VGERYKRGKDTEHEALVICTIQREKNMWGHGRRWLFANQAGGPQEETHSLTLPFRLSASQTVRKTFLLLKPIILQYLLQHPQQTNVLFNSDYHLFNLNPVN
jgi:hypothetical protein